MVKKTIMICKIFKINLKMKNYIVLFVSLLAMCHALSAQGYRRFSENTEAQTTIIRSYPMILNSVVCYSKDASSGYIELRVEDGVSGRVPVPLEYEVKDMKLFDNLLYFCGRHDIHGFIAVVDIKLIESAINTQNIFISPSYVTYSDVYVGLEKYSISSLDKLEVYTTPGATGVPPLEKANEHIIAIARNYKNAALPSSFPVHIKFNNVTPNPYGYSSGTISVEAVYNTNYYRNEVLHDVLVTNDFVSLIYSDNESYRLYKKRTTYPIATIFDTAYIYGFDQYEVLSEINGVALENNQIALSTLAVQNISSSTFEIRIRKINMPSMLMDNSQSLYLGENKQDMEMIYNKASHKIISMIPYYLPSVNSEVQSFIEIDPWNSSAYNAWAMYDNNYYSSMASANNSSFVSSFSNKWFRKLLPMNSSSSSCFSVFSIPVSLKSNLEHFERYYTTTKMNKVLSPRYLLVDIDAFNIGVDCE